MKTYLLRDLAVTCFVVIIQVVPGWVCIYYNKNIPNQTKEGFRNFTRIYCDLNYIWSQKKVFFIVLYRRPHQTSDEFDLFHDSLQLTVDRIKSLKPYCIVTSGDFNCRTKQWWPGDVEFPEGSALDEFIYFSSLGRNLSDPAHGTKSYWTTLNKIINKKKFSNIPPLLENGVFVTNFQTKANIFNNHFVEQCSLISNDSVLLISPVSRCNSSLSSVEITGEKILSIIRSLDPKKANGWDDTSINIIKLCDMEIVKPLHLTYKECLETGRFCLIGGRLMSCQFIKKRTNS